MIWVVVSAILFGFVHPGSKFIMDQGITLLPFCLLYVAIRLVVQIPIVLRGGHWKIQNKTQFLSLLSLGVVGVGLQISEFFGISKGLPVSMVTFLVYTHPIWTLTLSRVINREKADALVYLKLFLSIVGVALISGVSFNSGISPLLMIPSLFAGLMISIWITLSNKATKDGCTTTAISFYYDFFCFLFLFVFCFRSAGNLTEALTFVSSGTNLLMMSFYSIAIGLVPNCLFYFGSKKTTALAAGFILLLEPVISAGISHFVWNDVLSPTFVIGALCILLTNIPVEVFNILNRSFQNMRVRLVSTAPAISFSKFLMIGLTIGVLFSWTLLAAPQKALHFVEITPADPTDYIVNDELTQMDAAHTLAVKDFKQATPSCDPKVEKILKRGSEEEIYRTVHAISEQDPEGVLIGLGRTNFARVGAAASKNTKLLGISTGASATNLKDINGQFFTMASPWTKQWDAIRNRMKTLACTAANTYGVFDSRNVLSTQFLEKYKAGFTGLSEMTKLPPSDFGNAMTQKTCIFIALNISEARAYVASLIRSKWKGSLFGIGDWNIYSDEVKKTIEPARYSGLTIYMPTGWVPNATVRSKKFNEEMTKILGKSPSPMAAYTYDSTMIGLSQLCTAPF